MHALLIYLLLDSLLIIIKAREQRAQALAAESPEQRDIRLQRVSNIRACLI